MKSHEISWNLMKSHEISWNLMKSDEIPMSFLYFLQLSQFFRRSCHFWTSRKTRIACRSWNRWLLRRSARLFSSSVHSATVLTGGALRVEPKMGRSWAFFDKDHLVNQQFAHWKWQTDFVDVLKNAGFPFMRFFVCVFNMCYDHALINMGVDHVAFYRFFHRNW